MLGSGSGIPSTCAMSSRMGTCKHSWDAPNSMCRIPIVFCAHLTIAGLRVGSRYRHSVPSAKMMPVRVKFLILIIFRTRFPAPPPFLEDHQCEPSKNEARNKADNLAKGFKHSAFAVRAGCFGRSVGRLNEDAAGFAFDVKFPHF